MLSGWNEMDLNILANHLFELGGPILNVNIFLNNHPIQIVDLGLHEEGHHYYHHEEAHHHDHEGIWEDDPDMRPSHHDHPHYPNPNPDHYYGSGVLTLPEKIYYVKNELK